MIDRPTLSKTTALSDVREQLEDIACARGPAPDPQVVLMAKLIIQVVDSIEMLDERIDGLANRTRGLTFIGESR